MGNDWANIGIGALIAIYALNQVRSGLSARPRRHVDVVQGVGLAFVGGSGGVLAILRHAGRQWPLVFLVPEFLLGILGIVLIGLADLLKDQHDLFANAAACGNPPTVARRTERTWAVVTCVLAVLVAGCVSGVWPTHAMARQGLGFPSGLGAAFTTYAWIRARFRRRAPRWLSRMAQRTALPTDQA